MLRHMTESDRAVVEQAKGVLMLRYGVGARESQAVLERWAGEALVPVAEVADALVSGICQGHVTPEADGTVRWLEQRIRGGIDSVRDPVLEAGDDVAQEVTSSRSTTVAPATRVTPPAPRPQVTAALGQRQWRYTSALHAVRVMRSQ